MASQSNSNLSASAQRLVYEMGPMTMQHTSTISHSELFSQFAMFSDLIAIYFIINPSIDIMRNINDPSSINLRADETTNVLILENIYDFFEELRLALECCSTKRGCRNKRRRNDHDDNFLNIRNRWSELVNKFFQVPYSKNVRQEIAAKLIGLIYRSRTKFNIDSDKYKRAMSSVITPIIASIMDNKNELTKQNKDQQEFRKDFLFELLSNRIEEATEVISCDENSDVVVVCSQNLSQSQLQNQGDISSNRLQILRPFSLETQTIMDLLFDALTRHSRNISKTNLDYYRYIYHIMNIKYIVDVLYRQLKELKSMIPTRDREKSTAADFRGKILEAVTGYESSLENNLNMVDEDNPLSIFRRDLSKLHSQIQIVRLLMSVG